VVRLGREFDALRVAFSLASFFWQRKRKKLDDGARPAKLSLSLIFKGRY
jgi:hypothetical protein